MGVSNKVLSIKDIAAISGVSTATVSRVLNKKGGYSKETEERVLALVKSYGYVSNMNAKSLRESKSQTIGLIIPNIINPFYSTLAYHVENYFSEHNYSVFICNSANNIEKEKGYFRSLSGKGVDGIVCVSGLNELTDDIIFHEIPIVCIDRRPQSNRDIPQISNDNVEAAYTATRHLLQKGCRHILYISSYAPAYSGQDRFTGYQKALGEYGIPLDKNYIIERTGKEDSPVESEILVSQFLDSPYPVDGIFASNDLVALGALYALKQKNLSVPEDVKLIGFDNAPFAFLSSPTISSIERYPQDLAYQGCEILLNLIDGKKVDSLLTIIPTTLVERESSR